MTANMTTVDQKSMIGMNAVVGHRGESPRHRIRLADAVTMSAAMNQPAKLSNGTP